MAKDWTDGVPRLLVSECTGCGHRWYIQRDTCPRCGGDVRFEEAAGQGTVFALTTVFRSARGTESREPIGIVLVDLPEGVRIMARCDEHPPVGTAVRLSIRQQEDGQWRPFAAAQTDPLQQRV
jgi:uncharacterized protein